MPKFRLLKEEYETPYGTLVAPWEGTFEDEDPRKDFFLGLCDKGTMEVVPTRKPRKRKPEIEETKLEEGEEA